jgi:hypothetical protein
MDDIEFRVYLDDDNFVGCGINYIIFPDDGDDLFEVGVVGNT